MKKKLSIAGMLLMVCMLFCISKTTYAASRTITTNKSYDVILGNETKNYTVIVPNSGYFYYTVIPIKYIENGIESSSSSWYLPSTKMKVGYKLYEEQSVYYGRPFTSAAYSFKKGTRVNISLTDTNSSNTYAYYIGAYRIKSELEDLSLQYLKPDMYKKIEERKLRLEESSNDCLKEMLYKIETLLNDKNIPNEIKIRTKNIYGIYKRLNEGHKLSDIHDLLALKIMVDEVENCYRTLYLIHNEYHPINDKFKDYICNPKTNMYQSLHTTVFGPDDRLVQTQIRTFDMDKIASFGLSTYWDIEKGNAREVMQKDLSGKYQFFNSLVEINKVFGDNKEFINQVKNELFSNKIYVYTTKGEIMELPKGASVIDFAYKIHTDVGNTMVAAQVNNEYVDVMTELKNKDRVKIITDDLSYGPREDWEDKAVTTYAKRKIREFNRR